MSIFSKKSKNQNLEALIEKKMSSPDFNKMLEESAKRRELLFRGQRPDADDYGYSYLNPIMTSTIDYSTKYLESLCTPLGEPFRWNRSASYNVNIFGVNGVMVDEYELILNGSIYKKIYICPYGHNGKYLPKGLTNKEQLDKKKKDFEESAEYKVAKENISKSIEILEANAKISDKYIDDLDFGLSKYNPIYTIGPDGTAAYFHKLRTLDGNPIKYTLVCKEKVPEIEGKVCQYEISVAGKFYGNLFINMRSLRMSSGIPKGYSSVTIPSTNEVDKLIKNRSILAASQNYYTTEQIEIGLAGAMRGEPQNPLNDD